MSARIRVGVQVAQYGATWSELRRAAIDAEAMGADAIFDWDHFFGPGPASDAPHLESWTLLAAWAEATTTIALGPLVSAIGYRNPDLIADMARTVDHISGGRFVLGLGAGFKERDYLEYGYAYPGVGRRLTELEEGVGRIRRRLAHLNPPPVGRMPLLIGGSGEKRTLRIVARSADIWHTFADGEEFARTSRLLDGYCGEIGRDPREIVRSVLVDGESIDAADRLAEDGAGLFVVQLDRRQGIDLRPLEGWLRWRDRRNADR